MLIKMMEGYKVSHMSVLWLTSGVVLYKLHSNLSG